MAIKLEVGSLFPVADIPAQDEIQLNFFQDGLECRIFFDDPTSKKIQSIRKGLFQIKLLELNEIIFFLFRFDTEPWMDAAYTVHLSEPFEFEEMPEGTGFAFRIFFVDRKTAILKVIRFIGLEHNFSLRLRAAIGRQKAAAFEQQAYLRKVNQIYNIYSTDDLVRMAREQE